MKYLLVVRLFEFVYVNISFLEKKSVNIGNVWLGTKLIKVNNL